jgi:hypothetical protein
LQPTSPQQPKRLIKVYVFFFALQLSLGDHPLFFISRVSKKGRASHLKNKHFPGCSRASDGVERVWWLEPKSEMRNCVISIVVSVGAFRKD